MSEPKDIKAIELELGVPLFDRTTRKVHINKFGQLLLPYAGQITEPQDEYTAILRSSFETDHEILTLGSIYGLAQYKITDGLVNFKKSRLQSILNVMQASSRDLTEMLRQKNASWLLSVILMTRKMSSSKNRIFLIPSSSYFRSLIPWQVRKLFP